MVSDRLVTLSHPRRGFLGVHDDKSNKNIIVCAKDGEFAIGYTGSAYFGRQPTDQWIVSRLTREEFRDEPPLLAKSIHPDATVHEHIATLRAGIAQAPEGAMTKIVIVGFKNYRDMAIPFRATIGPARAFQGVFTPRKRGRGFQLFTAGALPPKDVTAWADAQMKQAQAYTTDDPERILGILTDVIRATAERNLTVGSDVMQIMRCRIVGQDSRFYRFVPKDTGMWTYSPWVIGAGAIYGPSRTNLGGLRIGPGFPVEDRSENPDILTEGYVGLPLNRPKKP